MWAAVNKQVGGRDICSLNGIGLTTATALMSKERVALFGPEEEEMILKKKFVLV